MKLNNKGWGTLEMFLLSGGLLIALLVAVFFISKLYGSLELSTSNRQYANLESDLVMAAKDYIRINNIDFDGNFIVSLKTLKDEGLVRTLKDNDGNDCEGYVKIINSNNTKYYNSFISCPNYKTTNYDLY